MAATAEDVIRRAEGEALAKIAEDPPKSNSVKYNRWYYGSDIRRRWCATFVSWCFFQEGLPLPASTPRGFDATTVGVAWFKHNGAWQDKAAGRPRPGWVVFFDFPNDNKEGVSHVGIVKGVRADGSLDTIEGNTDAQGSPTGGQVMEKHRALGPVVGYGIPHFAEPVVQTRHQPGTSLPAWENKEDDVKTKFVEIPLDHAGNGWTQWDPGLQREPVIVGLVAHGPYPPDDGYWDDADEDLTLRAQLRGANVVVSAVNGPPNGKARAFVSVV